MREGGRKKKKKTLNLTELYSTCIYAMYCTWRRGRTYTLVTVLQKGVKKVLRYYLIVFTVLY